LLYTKSLLTVSSTTNCNFPTNGKKKRPAEAG
jgi:hypothetical protein